MSATGMAAKALWRSYFVILRHGDAGVVPSQDSAIGHEAQTSILAAGLHLSQTLQ